MGRMCNWRIRPLSTSALQLTCSASSSFTIWKKERLTAPTHHAAQHATGPRRFARDTKPKHAPDRPRDGLKHKDEQEEGKGGEAERDGGRVKSRVADDSEERFLDGHCGYQIFWQEDSGEYG